MAQLPISIYVFSSFAVSLLLLHRYANWKRLPLLLTVAVFIAWFFALLGIAILPVDISNVNTHKLNTKSEIDFTYFLVLISFLLVFHFFRSFLDCV